MHGKNRRAALLMSLLAGAGAGQGMAGEPPRMGPPLMQGPPPPSGPQIPSLGLVPLPNPNPEFGSMWGAEGPGEEMLGNRLSPYSVGLPPMKGGGPRPSFDNAPRHFFDALPKRTRSKLPQNSNMSALRARFMETKMNGYLGG